MVVCFFIRQGPFSERSGAHALSMRRGRLGEPSLPGPCLPVALGLGLGEFPNREAFQGNGFVVADMALPAGDVDLVVH